jgi:hypothetical protein
MKAWSRRHTLIAGLALLLATNAVALVGVAYNRSGEADSVLQLTQRELMAPYAWALDSENGGMALTVQWRALPAKSDDPSDAGLSYAGWGVPEWLDEAKLTALGFDVSAAAESRDGARRIERQLPREVLLVLELAGPAYEQSLQRAREYAQREAALAEANPGKEEFKHRTKQAQERLETEQNRESRLFAVDAGIDAAALRAAYPDRTRHAIVRGQVQLYMFASTGKFRTRGFVTGLSIKEVNVPHAFRRAFEKLDGAGGFDPSARYTVAVAFGKRFEPWITAASASPVTD